MHDQLLVRSAEPDDAAVVAALVERTYRGPSSRQRWTSEADLIGGPRTSAAEIGALIAQPRSTVLLGERGDDLVACCHLAQIDTQTAYFGTFAVEPAAQGGGIGRHMISAAVDYARTVFEVARLEITVLAQQATLIAWYGRLGFQPTGQRRPFPADAGGAVPLTEDVHFIVMRRPLG